MNRLLLVLIVCLASASSIYAQHDTSKRINKYNFRSLINTGVLKGELSNPELQVQAINGLESKNWFLGIGAGIDFYENRSVPLFVHLRKNLFGSSNKFFVYADAGINLPWRKDEKLNGYENSFKSGKYYDAGLGYSIRVTKKTEYFISAGYTLKENINQTKYAYTTNGIIYWGEETERTYKNRRISLKFGWKF